MGGPELTPAQERTLAEKRDDFGQTPKTEPLQWWGALPALMLALCVCLAMASGSETVAFKLFSWESPDIPMALAYVVVGIVLTALFARLLPGQSAGTDEESSDSSPEPPRPSAFHDSL